MISNLTKVKAFQLGMGTKPDGIIGSHTKDCLYRQFGNPIFPYVARFFGCDVIVADPKDIVPINTKGLRTVKDYPFSMSGSFTYPSGVSPISIMVSEGKHIYDKSCHYWDYGGMPETVLYYTKDGRMGLKLARESKHLPNDTVWAIGGGQIAPTFNHVAEGFINEFYDVFRRAPHCAIGYDKYGNILGVYHKKCYLKDFRTKLIAMGMLEGIFVDGGHISAMNADNIKRNVNRKQGYIIKFGG